MQGQTEVFINAQSLEEQIDAKHPDHDEYCKLRRPEETSDGKDEHHETKRHQDGLGMLRVVKDLFDDIVGALKVGHLIDNDALDTGDRYM